MSETGSHAAAEAEFRTALAIQQKLADDNPAVTEFRSGLATSHMRLARAFSFMGKSSDGEAEFRTALAIQRKLAGDNPAVTEFRSQLALSHNNLGTVLSETGKPREAEAEFRTAVAIEQKLADDNPAVTEFRFLLSDIQNNLGLLLSRRKRFPEAFTALEAGLAIRQKLRDADPKNINCTSHLGYSYADRGRARVLAGQPALAAADLRRARQLWAKLPKSDVETRFEQARVLAHPEGLGQDAKSGVTAAEAAVFVEEAVATLRDAIGAGWARCDELKEPEFDSFRNREDFKKLAEELEKKAEPKK